MHSMQATETDANSTAYKLELNLLYETLNLG